MKITFLDFEQPVAELEAKIEELRFAQDDSAVDISAEILRLQKKSQSLTSGIYAKRHPGRSRRSPDIRSARMRSTISSIYSPISKSFMATGDLPMTRRS